MIRQPPRPPLFPYTTLFRSLHGRPARSPRHRHVTSPSHAAARASARSARTTMASVVVATGCASPPSSAGRSRSEEHTSELQSRQYLVCRLLLEKKKKEFIRRHMKVKDKIRIKVVFANEQVDLSQQEDKSV